MSKFVMVRFGDGDYRVYRKVTANKKALRLWNEERKYITAEVVAESKDKNALIPMATLAREDYMEKEGLTPKEDVADYTENKVFP